MLTRPSVRTATASDRFVTPTYRAAIEPYLPEIAIDTSATPARSPEIASYIAETPARSTEIASYTSEMAGYTSEMAVYTTEMAVDASEIAIYTAEMAVYSVEMPGYVMENSSYTAGSNLAASTYVMNRAQTAHLFEQENCSSNDPWVDQVARNLDIAEASGAGDDFTHTSAK